MSGRLLDAVLIAGVGVFVLGGVVVGTRGIESTAAPIDRERVLLPHGDLVQRSRDARSGIDPYNPPGMPAGTSIDRETGLIVGLELAPAAGQATPGWPLLSAGNEAAREADLPAEVRALDGRPVVLAGFMMALYALRDIREFALVGSHTQCCFGVPPGVGDQVIVKLARDASALDLTLAPVRVEGIFRIRAQHLYRDGTGPLIWLYEVVEARAVPYAG